MTSVVDFGADPTGATDSTAAFNAALAGALVIYVPPGAYKISGTITVPERRTLFSDSSASASLVCQAGNYTTLSVQGSGTTVRGFTIDSTIKGGGPDYSIDCGSNVIYDSVYEDIRPILSFQIWGDSGVATGRHFRTYTRRIISHQQRGPGYVVRRGYAYLHFGLSPFEDAVDFVGSPSPDHTAFDMDSSALTAAGLSAVGGVYVSLGVGGTASVGAGSGQKGFDIRNTDAIYLNGSSIDSVGGVGVSLDNCQFVQMGDVSSALCNGHAILLKDVRILTDARLHCRGRRGQPGAVADQDGVRLEGVCQDLNFTSIYSIGFTGNAFHGVGVTYLIDVAVLKAVENGLLAVKTTNATSSVRIGGGQFNMNNLLGTPGLNEYALASSVDWLVDVQLTSGGLTQPPVHGPT